MKIYCQIKNHPKYFINQDGSVRSVNRFGSRILKFTKNKTTGYIYYVIWTNGRYHTVYMHRLLLETFVGPCPKGMECRHLDDNKSNNSLDNLIWGTHIENCADRIKNGNDYRTNIRKWKTEKDRRNSIFELCNKIYDEGNNPTAKEIINILKIGMNSGQKYVKEWYKLKNIHRKYAKGNGLLK